MYTLGLIYVFHFSRSFFSLWWEEQDINTREKLKELVKNGQFEFIGGNYNSISNALTFRRRRCAK
jgi:hypothetical protein